MTYHSLEEIFDEKRRALEAIGETVRSLSLPQAAFRLTPEAWSVSQVVEHLAAAEPGMLRLIGSLTRKAERLSPGAPAGGLFEVHIPEEAGGGDGRKYRTRADFEPVRNLPVPSSLHVLEEVQRGLEELRPAIGLVDVTSVFFPHAELGPITLGQWLAFVGVHERRHLWQIRAVLASPSFPLSGTTA
jgi:hypothetical protein